MAETLEFGRSDSQSGRRALAIFTYASLGYPITLLAFLHVEWLSEKLMGPTRSMGSDLAGMAFIFGMLAAPFVLGLSLFLVVMHIWTARMSFERSVLLWITFGFAWIGCATSLFWDPLLAWQWFGDRFLD